MSRKGKSHSTIDVLLHRLDSDDPGVRKTAQRDIAKQGKRVVPDLVLLLGKGSRSAKRAGATLLGKMGNARGPEARALEAALLADGDPKLRKNAAMALGRLKSIRSLRILKEAVETEAMDWVKPTIILAVGAIGGREAKAILEGVSPNTRAQEEAIRKALGQAGETIPSARWIEGRKIDGLHAATPVGLEEIAVKEAREAGYAAECVGPGLIGWQKGVLPDEVFPRLRCIYHLLVPLSVTQARLPAPMGKWPDEIIAGQLADLLKNAVNLRSWRDWLSIDGDRVNFRFFVSGERVSPRTIKRLSRISRDVLGAEGWFDNPHSYSVELGLRLINGNIALVIRPAFMQDERFAYRQKDVGASINPVVAACLAHMAGPAHGGRITDPTCGSGTLLVECAFLDDKAALWGVDISPTAISAAAMNMKAAGLTGRARLVKGDAGDTGNWEKSNKVISNLPFGMRIRQGTTQLRRLYADVVRNACEYLLEDGRIVLCTAKKDILLSAIHDTGVKLDMAEHYEAISGGITIHVLVLKHR